MVRFPLFSFSPLSSPVLTHLIVLVAGRAKDPAGRPVHVRTAFVLGKGRLPGTVPPPERRARFHLREDIIHITSHRVIPGMALINVIGRGEMLNMQHTHSSLGRADKSQSGYVAHLTKRSSQSGYVAHSTKSVFSFFFHTHLLSSF